MTSSNIDQENISVIWKPLTRNHFENPKHFYQEFGEIRCDQTWIIAGPERAIFWLQRLQKAACSASHLLRRMEPSRVCCSRDHWENCGERTLQGLDQNQTDRGPGNVKLPQMWQDRQGGLGFPSGKYFDVYLSFFWISVSKPIQSLPNQFRMFWILSPKILIWLIATKRNKTGDVTQHKFNFSLFSILLIQIP